MPSPFPGMDPFLEDPTYFRDLHVSFICHASGFLQQTLPEPYFAILNERLWDEPPDDQCRESLMEIRFLNKQREEQIVTTIEVLSHANKIAGEKSRENYLAKQAEILESTSNLVEIDLLRSGLHSTAAPREFLKKLAVSFDYHVCVHDKGKPRQFEVYLIQMENNLPTIMIPLLPGVKRVPLNLQDVFDLCYKAGPYSRRVDYDVSNVIPPLTAKQTRWAKQRLREANLEK